MGYGKKTDSSTGKTFDLDKTYLNVIKPAVIEAGLECIRGDELQESGLIDKSMYALLVHADLVIADISTYNPNAIYELGIRHAARPFTTIILKEDQTKNPFDLNHNKIFHYTHLGEDIGVSEAERCKTKLVGLINSIIYAKVTDSPFFEFISDVQPCTLKEEDYISIIKELAENEKSIYAITERARQEMSCDNFVEAAKLWKKASDKAEGESYFTQQQALCTYKSKQPSESASLLDALNIINELDIDNTNDPETLGITGAIYKRLWLINKDIEFLNRSIDYYQKGFQINSDYYTGENYALCLDFKAANIEDDEEKIYCKIAAKKTRRQIVDIIDNILEDENANKRNDIKWLYASMSICLFALNEEYKQYEELFFSSGIQNWERESYETSKQQIQSLNKN
jgi:tetratricopeptide (TPR) repeat protein